MLQPGRSATVNTQIAITQTGEYVLEVDWLDDVKESNEFNNTLRTLLVGRRPLTWHSIARDTAGSGCGSAEQRWSSRPPA